MDEGVTSLLGFGPGCRGPGGGTAARRELGESLLEFSRQQPAAETSIAEKPRVNPLAQWQLPQADNVLTLLNLDVRVEDEISRHLLEICDGTRGKDELLAEMRRFIEESDDVDDRAALLEDLSEWLDESLAQLARLGMFS